MKGKIQVMIEHLRGEREINLSKPRTGWKALPCETIKDEEEYHDEI